MNLTASAIRDLQAARWEPNPETVGFLRLVKTTLTEPETDGVSMLERIYLTCDFENQRNREVEAAVFAVISKRYKEKVAFFSADCPEDGRCRFHLRIARTHPDLAATPAAHATHFLNLLKPHDEWVRPPEPTNRGAI